MRTPLLSEVLGREADLYPPKYTGASGDRRIFLGASCMSRHTADAGWQLTLGFHDCGYALWGYGFPNSETHVPSILSVARPNVVVVQDKREWECKTAGQRGDPRYKFLEVEELADRDDIFKLTVLKDCHQHPDYHRKSAEEMGVHAWIVYYHPDIVKHFAPYVRKEHLIRVYHTVDKDAVPKYTAAGRKGCLLSGAVGPAYPLRTMITRKRSILPQVEYLKHPGYHANGCVTPEFLRKLSQYKVAICTSSRYGYALRKHIEATAAGCTVITDLPVEDPLPFIDGNLIRIPRELSKNNVREALVEAYNCYDPERQKHYSDLAKEHYDYRAMARKMCDQIEQLRNRYAQRI